MRLKKLFIVMMAVLLAGSMTACKKSEPDEDVKVVKDIDKKDKDVDKDPDKDSDKAQDKDRDKDRDKDQDKAQDKDPDKDSDKAQDKDPDKDPDKDSDKAQDKDPDNDLPGQTGGDSSDKFVDLDEDVQDWLYNLSEYLLTGKGDGFLPENLTKEQKDKLKKAVEAEGGKLEFKADGSVYMAKDGAELTIDAEGKVRVIDPDGNEFNFTRSSNWPDLQIAKGMPVPEGSLLVIEQSENQVAATVSDMSYEQAEQYAKELKKAGFTQDVTEADYEAFGMVSFSGKNAAGVMVSFTYVNSIGGSVLLEK